MDIIIIIIIKDNNNNQALLQKFWSQLLILNKLIRLGYLYSFSSSDTIQITLLIDINTYEKRRRKYQII